MKKGKCIRNILLILLLSLACLGIAGCREEEPKTDPEKESKEDPEKEPIDGGVTDKSDPNAPKNIVSGDISDYYARFCLEGEWAPGYKNTFYTFEIRPDAAGILTASESATGVSAAADQSLLDSLQEIIDKYGLVAENGKYTLTAGIDPSMYGPCTLKVDYASGEKLTFTCDNDPDAEWAAGTYLTFAKWFADKGISSLLPADYEKMVSDISIVFNDIQAGHSYSYSIEEERDRYGRLVLTRTVDGKTEQAVIFSSRIFFDSISRSVSDFDLQEYGALADGKEDADLRISISFEDGHRAEVATSDTDTADELVVLLDELFDLFDSYFK